MQQKIQIIAVAAIAVAIIIGICYFALPEIDKMDQKNQVQLSVQKTIESFDGDLNSVVLTQGKYYSFVFDGKLEKLVLHPREELIDTLPPAMKNANITIIEMRNGLMEDGAVWIQYEFDNPETGNVEPKTTYLVGHEGYVFAAGYYSP